MHRSASSNSAHATDANRSSDSVCSPPTTARAGPRAVPPLQPHPSPSPPARAPLARVLGRGATHPCGRVLRIRRRRRRRRPLRGRACPGRRGQRGARAPCGARRRGRRPQRPWRGAAKCAEARPSAKRPPSRATLWLSATSRAPAVMAGACGPAGVRVCELSGHDGGLIAGAGRRGEGLAGRHSAARRGVVAVMTLRRWRRGPRRRGVAGSCGSGERERIGCLRGLLGPRRCWFAGSSGEGGLRLERRVRGLLGAVLLAQVLERGRGRGARPRDLSAAHPVRAGRGAGGAALARAGERGGDAVPQLDSDPSRYVARGGLGGGAVDLRACSLRKDRARPRRGRGGRALEAPRG